MSAATHQNWRYLFQTGWLLIITVLALSNTAQPVWTGLLVAGVVSALLVKRAACSCVCPIFPVGELLWRGGEKLFGRTFAVPFWFDLVLRSAKYLVLGWMVWALLSAEMGTEFNSVPVAFPLVCPGAVPESLRITVARLALQRTDTDHKQLRRFSIGKLKIAGDNAWNCNVFVQLLPTQGITVQSQGHLLELLIRRLRQQSETIGREANYPMIR